MPTVRSKLSKKNKYYIPEHRFLELKHFCLQYKNWQDALKSMSTMPYSMTYDRMRLSKTNDIFDPTMRNVLIREFYRKRINLVETAANLSDPLLSLWIIKGVTEGRSYDNLSMMYTIPCDRNTYYDRYRKFFYILDNLQTHGITDF